MRKAWNHNLHYHDLVLRLVPTPCASALDVGCGEGLLSRRLASRCSQVVALDLDADPFSASTDEQPSNVFFLCADILKAPLPASSFDFIATIATLHHLPLQEGLTRLMSLLKPGGVLVVIGLYRPSTLADYTFAALALPASWVMQRLHHFNEVQAATKAPDQTLSDIRRAAEALLPGASIHRRLFFRYSLTWRKPANFTL